MVQICICPVNLLCYVTRYVICYDLLCYNSRKLEDEDPRCCALRNDYESSYVWKRLTLLTAEISTRSCVVILAPQSIPPFMSYGKGLIASDMHAFLDHFILLSETLSAIPMPTLCNPSCQLQLQAYLSYRNNQADKLWQGLSHRRILAISKPVLFLNLHVMFLTSLQYHYQN